MLRRRATVATPGEWQCKTGGVRRLAVGNGPNIFQMLLVVLNFWDSRRSSLTLRQKRHLPMGKVKTRGKLGYPNEILTFQDGGWLPPDSGNLDLTWEFQIWKFRLGKIPQTPTKLTQCKNPIQPMHSSAWQFRELRPLPKFLFGDRSTFSLDIWLGLTQRVTHKFLGEIPLRSITYEFPKFPIISLWENHLWRQTCWLSSVWGSCENLVLREIFFRFSEVGLKRVSENFSHFGYSANGDPQMHWIIYGKLPAYVMSYRFQWKIQFMNIHNPPESYKGAKFRA